MAAKRPGMFSPAPAPPAGVPVDEPARSLASVPDSPAPVSPPVSVSPDSVSLHVSKQTGGGAIDLADLVAGRPDPELDLVAFTVRIPRYLVQALDLQTRVTRRPKQSIVTDALSSGLDERFVGEAYDKARGK